MDMGMKMQVLAPGVQHGQEAGLSAEVPGVRGDRVQRFGGCPEQDVVDDDLVLEGDDGDLVGYGEDHVKVRYVEQFRPPVLEPLRACETLALAAVPVAAGVVRDALLSAIVAALDVAAECGRLQLRP